MTSHMKPEDVAPTDLFPASHTAKNTTRRAIVADLGELLLEPEIAPWRPWHVGTGALDNKNVLDTAGFL